MKATRFAAALMKAIKEVDRQHGIERDIEVIPCDVVQICANGRHKDIETGKFVK